ncbi:hypothetical protein [Actinokineospora iranica]|uniref:DUF4913 domain-containing protein n=1 Tax=Actinokineospora iranica TaxID=1271860 RepID=A0A1G6VS12_9PSEU|nr:hypothetical protein [Actinokineospora iranica]SDD56368.1 hypothetical protein SAMN05216174_11365 [Actinokineospora iranica]
MDDQAPPNDDEQGRDDQIAALAEILEQVEERLHDLEAKVDALGNQEPAERKPHEPAPWVWYSPPAAAEDDPDSDLDPRFTVDNFIGWYNTTLVGTDGSSARPIPDCWRQHTGLALEVAALAYSWREANMGKGATARDAQYWLHQWRPAFTDRMTRNWVHPDCLDGKHRRSPLAPRSDRFTLSEEHVVVADNHRETGPEQLDQGG